MRARSCSLQIRRADRDKNARLEPRQRMTRERIPLEKHHDRRIPRRARRLIHFARSPSFALGSNGHRSSSSDTPSSARVSHREPPSIEAVASTALHPEGDPNFASRFPRNDRATVHDLLHPTAPCNNSNREAGIFRTPCARSAPPIFTHANMKGNAGWAA